MIPQDIANPFTQDSLLKHLTVFSHVFPDSWDQKAIDAGDEVKLLALNGAEAVISKREGDDIYH